MHFSSQRQREIEEKAGEILHLSGVDSPPVAIDRIVWQHSVKIKFSRMDLQVSGILMVKDGKGIIGVQSADPPVRQRFTIAHELGHYVLHIQQGKQVFVEDKMYRKVESGDDERRMEQEANIFAAAILMPEKLVCKELETFTESCSRPYKIKRLAERFCVSEAAMTFRLTNLELA